MSRSTVAKSRADKGGKSGYGSAPTPAVTHEIVPGKFNDQDWNFMVEHDDGDDFVQGIVEEVCAYAMDTIYKNYLQKQLIPYNVMQAKDAMLQIIEWQFLAHDEGEQDVETDLNWMEDEEPECAVTDCWAQGSVPKSMFTSTPREITMEVLEEEPEPQTDMEEERSQPKGVDDQPQLPENLQPTGSQSSIVIVESKINGCTTQKQPEQLKAQETKNKKKTFKPHYGPLRNAKVEKMTESLEDREMEMLYAEMPTPPPPKTPETAIFQMPNSCHSIIKLQAGRPPGTRDVVYDHAGNVVSMTKLNPERLPNHRVRTGFQVVDPQVEAAQARLEAMRTGRHLKAKKPAPPNGRPIPTKGEEAPSNVRRRQMITNTNVRSSKEEISKLAPPLIDSMELSPGVVVREGDRIKRGPKQNKSKSDFSSVVNRNLRPVVVHGGSHLFSVQDLLGDQQPVIRPLESPPIPPIRPHPPAQKAV